MPNAHWKDLNETTKVNVGPIFSYNLNVHVREIGPELDISRKIVGKLNNHRYYVYLTCVCTWEIWNVLELVLKDCPLCWIMYLFFLCSPPFTWIFFSNYLFSIPYVPFLKVYQIHYHTANITSSCDSKRFPANNFS